MKPQHIVAVVLCSLVLACAGTTAPGEGAKPGAPQLGTVRFSTTCTPAAQEEFSVGLAVLHHMMYSQARQAFQKAAATDPQCAMAFWGVAMSYVTPLWPGKPTDEEMQQGRAAVEVAEKSTTASQRERDYVAAIKRFYEDGADHATRLTNMAAGYTELRAKYSDDTDAAAFWALMHVAVAPKSDTTYANQREAGALLEQLYAKEPHHPGLMHYLIHAYDSTALAPQAIEVARSYDKIAPEVPHALHMPSHIFVRLGLWDDVVAWNMRSARAAKAQPMDGKTSFHHAHALDYVIYAHLQKGGDQKAAEALAELMGVQDYAGNLAASFARAAAPARYALERGAWQEAATLPDLSPDLAKYAGAEAIVIFARGIGAARSGDLAGANQQLAHLDALSPKLAEKADAYWRSRLDIKKKVLSGWIAFLEGDKERGIASVREAADLEDALDKHPVTPGHVLPARQSLAEMLATSGQPQLALQAYQDCLKYAPGRFACLAGAGRTAQTLGQAAGARGYYEQLVKTAGEGTTRPELQQAQAYLSTK